MTSEQVAELLREESARLRAKLGPQIEKLFADVPPYTREQLMNHVPDPRIHAANMRAEIAGDCEEECLESAKKSAMTNEELDAKIEATAQRWEKNNERLLGFLKPLSTDRNAMTNTPTSKPTLSFFVPGIPATAGSKKFVGIGKKTGRAILVDASGEKGKNWRQTVQWVARDALQAHPGFTAPASGPLRLRVEFILPWRKADIGRDGHAKTNASFYHTTKPDATKLLRSIEDALTGIAWVDDAQICEQVVTKQRGFQPGARVTITPTN